MKKILFVLCAFIMSASTVMAQEVAGMWQIKLNAGGYTSFTKDNGNHDQSFVFDFGTGYQVDENFYAGLATGVWTSVGHIKNDAFVPVLFDLTFSPDHKKVTPYLTVRGGMAVNIVSQESAAHVPFYAVGELQGGIAIALNENLDLTCAAFSQRLEPIHTQVDKHGIGNIGLKVGFNMHF